MNKVLVIVMLSIMIALIFAPIFTYGESQNEEFEPIEVPVEVENIETEDECTERLISEMQAEMDLIESIENEKEWLITYKEIIEKYSNVLDPPETIYDYFPDKELELLFRVTEAEATEGGFLEKANVASVIFNRIEHEEFGNTLSDVLTEDQFSTISDGRYLTVEITEDAVLACEYAFMIQDTTNGALFFEKGTDVHSSYADYTFTDNIGHRFYVEKEK